MEDRVTLGFYMQIDYPIGIIQVFSEKKKIIATYVANWTKIVKNAKNFKVKITIFKNSGEHLPLLGSRWLRPRLQLQITNIVDKLGSSYGDPISLITLFYKKDKNIELGNFFFFSNPSHPP